MIYFLVIYVTLKHSQNIGFILFSWYLRVLGVFVNEVYLCFNYFLYPDLYVLGDDALIN